MVAAVAIAANFMILTFKYYKGRTTDLFVDGAIFVVLAFLFGGTGTGLISSMIAGGIISIYLFFVIPADKKKKKKAWK
jgi:hypothetical protein